jgi:dephospho-CoA kinase
LLTEGRTPSSSLHQAALSLGTRDSEEFTNSKKRTLQSTMVFLSSFKAFWNRPFGLPSLGSWTAMPTAGTAAAAAAGGVVRSVSRRWLWLELLRGIGIVAPITAFLAHIVIRCVAMSVKQSYYGGTAPSTASTSIPLSSTSTTTGHSSNAKKDTSIAVADTAYTLSTETIPSSSSSSSSFSSYSFPWWTTLWITLLGDLLLECLLPSLQCVPWEDDLFDDISNNDVNEGGHVYIFRNLIPFSYLRYVARTWGWGCPATPTTPPFSSEAVGMLLTIRLLCMTLGAYLGESWMPIALTGGIATGKSTVAHLLSRGTSGIKSSSIHNSTVSTSGGNTANTQKASKQRKAKKPSSRSRQSQTNSNSTDSLSDALVKSDDDEGTFLIVDSDQIAHDILLPPWVLEEESSQHMVQPQDSIYNRILRTFGDEQKQYSNILMDDQSSHIDRRKLGAIIFQDRQKRKALNKLTHPRILYIMWKQVVYGIFCSSYYVVCVDIPLLFESGYFRYLFALTICVVCHPDVQLERLRQRNPDLTEQQCRERIASQMDLDRKIALAHIVIENNGDTEDLAQAVEAARRDVMARIFGVGMSLVQILLLVGGPLTLAISSNLFSSITSVT